MDENKEEFVQLKEAENEVKIEIGSANNEKALDCSQNARENTNEIVRPEEFLPLNGEGLNP